MAAAVTDLLGNLVARAGCPKHMVFGPCGGVRADGACEMTPEPCPFLAAPAPPWPLADAAPTPVRTGSLLDRAARRPVVVTDLTVAPYDAASVADITGRLAGAADALLIGEHHNRPDYPPTLLASLVLQAGGRPIVTLSCRDRNRLVLEQEVQGLAALGVEAALCVTGDGRGHGVRPGVTQVFDLDGPRLAALAAAAGVTAAVPESPQAPPHADRAWRLLQKQRAGASLCLLNHVSSAAELGDFIAVAREAGVTMPFIAGVAVYVDRRSAEALLGFPGLHLDRAAVSRVLTAADPLEAGVESAVAEARALLEVPGVVGVNLSGLGSGDGLVAAAEVKARIGRELLAA